MSLSRTKSHYFYRIIFSHSSANHRLRIPNEFMKQYGNIVPSHVCLEVPTGAVWQAKLRKSNGIAWLQNGWQEFKDYYKIGYGHFLVFKYDGKSHFHVLIFDASCSEIEYPFSTTHVVQANIPGNFQVKREDSEVHDSVEFLENFPTCQTRQKSPALYSRHRKKTKTKRTCEERNLNRGCQVPKMEEKAREDSVEILNDFQPRQRTRKNSPVSYSQPSKKKKTLRTCEGPNLNRGCRGHKIEETARNDLVEFMDDFPPIGQTFEKPNLNRGCRLHKTEDSSREDSVEILDHLLTKSRRPRSTDKSENTSQYKAFGQSTGPQANRVKPVVSEDHECSCCSMQGVKDGPKRCQHFPTGRKRLASDTNKVRALQSAKASKSGNLSFMVVIQASYIAKCTMHIPRRFIIKYFTKEHNDVTLQVSDGRTWSVKYSISRHNARFQNGWVTFAQENSLALGDVCVFELIKCFRNLLRVEIFRAAEDADCYLSSGCRVPKMEGILTEDSVEILDDFPPRQRPRENSLPPHIRFSKKRRPNPIDKSESTFTPKTFVQSTGPQASRLNPVKSEEGEDSCGFMQGLVGDGPERFQYSKLPTGKKQLAGDTEKVRALQSAKAFKSKNPFSMVVMQPSYVKNFTYIPQNFAKKYFIKEHKDVTLQVPDGRTWSVKYTIFPNNARLHSGWITFAQENSLAVGDVCVFELIKCLRNILRVEIFRAAGDPHCYLSGGLRVPKMEEILTQDSVEILDDFPSGHRTREKSLPPHLQFHKKGRPNPIDKSENTFNPKTFVQSSGPQASSLKPVMSEEGEDSYGFVQGLVGDRPRRCQYCKFPSGRKPLASVTEKVRALQSAKAFRSKNPFFRVAMCPSYVATTMYIPRKFVNEYFIKKHNNVTLQVLDGRTWFVKYNLSPRNARFKTGWATFAEENSLAEGDVCVFELIKGFENLLRVEIFRAAEDPYCCLNSECRVPKMEKNSIEDSIEILNDFPQSLRTGENSQSLHLLFDEKRTPNPIDKPENTFTSKAFVQSTGPQANRARPVKSEEGKDSSYYIDRLIGDGHERCQNSKFPSGRKQFASDTEKVRALQSAKAFKSENPWIMVVMRPSYIANYAMYISQKFVKKYFIKEHKDVTLQVPDGRTWSIKYTIHPKNARLRSGWATFARENSLAVGDVCVFELIKSFENSLRVEIFRAAENSDCCPAAQKQDPLTHGSINDTVDFVELNV